MPLCDRDHLAQLILIGWRGGSPAILRRLLKRCPAGGILILRHGDVRETGRFIRGLPKDLIVAADVEDGLAQRFPGAVPHPSARAVGATGDPRLARLQGLAVGAACRRMGIHLAFAPVVDVNSNPLNPIINTRSFGEDPALVARMGAAWILGCQAAGVLACAKHFPGHGDTRTDSHDRLPSVPCSLRTAWKRELVPFRSATRADVASVMTAHVAFPALDGKRPATLSHRLVTGILREGLGFHGLVITDSLRMKGLSAGWDEGEAAVEALKAGCDILLDPTDPEAVLDRLEKAVRRKEMPWPSGPLRRLEAARRRLATRAPVPQVDEAQARRRVARAAVTLQGVALPRPDLRTKPSLWILLNDGSAPERIRAFRGRIRRYFPKARFSGAGPFPWAIVCLFAKVRMSKGRIAAPKALIAEARRLSGRAERTLALLAGSPYPAKDLPASWPKLFTYSDAPDSLEAALEALAGRLKPK